MSIPQFSATDSADAIAHALAEAGCVVVTDAMDTETRQSITTELAPYMAAARVIEDDDPEEFYPGQTRRITALLARSASVTDALITRHDVWLGEGRGILRRGEAWLLERGEDAQ